MCEMESIRTQIATYLPAAHGSAPRRRTETTSARSARSSARRLRASLRTMGETPRHHSSPGISPVSVCIESGGGSHAQPLGEPQVGSVRRIPGVSVVLASSEVPCASSRQKRCSSAWAVAATHSSSSGSSMGCRARALVR